ncbi:RIP metalloprotease RseP [Hufsiella ginkgonis]|uniref:Zinc metalloprotease n=1 Tax=Hufsiella ginkgonis TaxID=2695274 RepID=A0A7K1XWZ3_9SPHI|nr:RIP metalloprotease RseP [Hufsiella ginkgonis]MXV15036.1 RIP metalloprotease RseP [Hufsiella ginkgonis]
MDGLIMAGQLLLGLSILIILHELGHFLAARAFGIRVEKFYLFFDAWGYKLVSFKFKGCEYGIGWLPLGGYVKISGMIDESMDTEQMSGPPQPWEFRSKPAWQRLIVMLGGVTVNVILGILIFWMLVVRYGDTYIPTENLVNGITPGIIGKEVGLLPGDKIVTVNGLPVKSFEEIASSKVLLGNSELGIERNGQPRTIKIPDNVLEMVSDHGIAQFVLPRYSSVIDTVFPKKGAIRAGLQKGDRLTDVNFHPVRYQDEVKQELQKVKNKWIVVKFTRNGKAERRWVYINKYGELGYGPNFDEIKEDTLHYGFFTALPVGASKAWGSLTDNAKGLWKVVSGKIKATKAFSGPMEIARKFYGGTFTAEKFWGITGLLSMALALMNLLPIPALDGGHAVFLLVEMIKGKPLSDKFMERAQMVGFCILVVLMVFVMGNDVLKAVVGK